MATDIMVVAFSLVIIIILLIITILTDESLFLFLDIMVTLVFVAFLISGDGLVTISSFFNTTTATIIHNNVAAYPDFVIGYAILVLIQIIIFLRMITVSDNIDESIH